MKIFSTPYTDTGWTCTIFLLALEKIGYLVSVIHAESHGTPRTHNQAITDRAFCPCCMTPETRQRIMDMIHESGVDEVVWMDSYADRRDGLPMSTWFADLLPAGTDNEYAYRIRDRKEI